MLKYYEGTVFNTGATTIVNAVNCTGVMGAGIALEFKLRYPEMFEEYVERCEKKEYSVGRPRLYKAADAWILNFPTKNHWRYPSQIQWIEEGLKYFVSNYKRAGIKSVAFPKLGASNGGLEWSVVKDLMVKYLEGLDIDVYICLDEIKEAEGIEKRMVDAINKATMDEVTKNMNIRKKQATTIMETLPITRFWHLNKVKGLGDKSYMDLFSYYYKLFQGNEDVTDELYTDNEQLSLF